MARLMSAILVTGLVLVLGVSCAWAYPYSASRLVGDNIGRQAIRLDNFSDRPPQKGMGWEIYRKLDEVPLLTAEMIRDEHWLKVIKFERDTSTILPLLSAQLYIQYRNVAHSRVRREPSMEGRSRVTSSGGKLPDPGIPLLLRLLFPTSVKGEAIGLLERESRRRTPHRRYGLLNWLFEEQGVFSGEAWDWENFLPRLLSVVALVVVGLLIIEFLRFLVLLGMRAVGSVDRRQL